MREDRTRRLCELYLDSHQLHPPLLTLGSNGAIKNAARMGLRIALQSREAVELELDAGRLATISPRGGLPKRAWRGLLDRRAELDAVEEFIVRALGGRPGGPGPPWPLRREAPSPRRSHPARGGRAGRFRR